MRKFLLLFGFFVFVGAGLCRAQVVVKGTVQDSTGKPLPTVSVYATGLDFWLFRSSTPEQLINTGAFIAIAKGWVEYIKKTHNIIDITY